MYYIQEVNVRAAAVLGLVGAGGGLYYDRTLGFYNINKLHLLSSILLLLYW